MANEKFTKYEMQEYAKRYIAELKLANHAMWAIDSIDGIPEYINNTRTEISESGYCQSIKEIPDYCGLPYFATIDNIEGFTMLTVLCVSPYREDEQYNLRQVDNNVYIANAYVINLDEPTFSEAGSVTIKVDRQNQTLRRIY